MLEASCLLSKPHTVLHRLSAMQVGGRQTPTATPCGCLKQCPSRAHLAPGPAPAQRARAARRSVLRVVSGDAAVATDEPKLQRPDVNGRFGKYGGKCVATSFLSGECAAAWCKHGGVPLARRQLAE